MTNGAMPDGARDVAVETALAAGAILRERLSLDRTIDFKGAIDLVTDADRASEELIEAAIISRFPDHRFVGEETTFLSGDTPAGSELYSWLVDPLDGTTNYAHRYPHFAVSIALEHAGRSFSAWSTTRCGMSSSSRSGAGATLNGDADSRLEDRHAGTLVARHRVSPTPRRSAAKMRVSGTAF